jgi:hypothetical protein
VTTREREQQIRERLASAPAMSAAQLQAQRVSFAYGNVKIDEPTVTRELVESLATGRR